MTEFTAKDRALIIKLARKLDAVTADVLLLKQKKSTSKTTKQTPDSKPLLSTFAGMPVIMNKFDATFSKDVKWTDDEKTFVLQTLYDALKTICKDSGILELSVQLKIQE